MNENAGMVEGLAHFASSGDIHSKSVAGLRFSENLTISVVFPA